MAQQILNVSTPNSGLGDALRDASIKSNDNFTELYDNKVDKVTGKDLSDNNLTNELVTKINNLEALAQVNVQSDWNENDILADAFIKNKPTQLLASLGYFDYADLATQTTPITVAPNTQTLLTNDTLGADTDISQPPYAVTEVWNAGTANFFDFQQLSIGDTVDIRFHIKVTTSANNQLYHIDLKAGIGSASEFENRIFSQYVKTAGEDEQTFITSLYIGSNDIKDYPAQVFIQSTQSCTVKVLGWFVRVFRKSVNIVNIITDEAPIDGLTYGRKDADWVEVTGGTVPDATNTVKGKLKLAGDLGGTADLPTVPDLANKANDSAVVHNTGAETIAGNKTFTDATVIGDATVGTTNFGLEPNAIIGDTTGGVLDIRNTNTNIVGGETVGTLQFSVKDDVSNGYVNAQIKTLQITGAGTGDAGQTDLVFYTNDGGTGTSPTEKLRLGETSSVITGNISAANLSGTNTGDDATNSQYSGLASSKQDYAVATTSTAITFDLPKIYYTFGSPTTATLSAIYTGARIGVVQKIYVNHTTDPVVGLSGWVRIGSGTYVSGKNIIFAEYSEAGRVEYWIVKV